MFANAVPKSGTHLLLRLLERLGVERDHRWRFDPRWTRERSWGRRLAMRPRHAGDRLPLGQGVFVSAAWARRVLRTLSEGRAILGHCDHAPELASLVAEAGVKTVLIVRDPRDVAVSHAHFLVRIGKRRFVRTSALADLVALPDAGARIQAMLEGRPGVRSIAERYRSFDGWRTQPGVCLVRFEDLVGARGGGDDERQRAAVLRVVEHLGLQLTPEQLGGVAASLFGEPGTFRKGTIGQWREEFGPEHRAVADRTLRGVLRAYGYPED